MTNLSNGVIMSNVLAIPELDIYEGTQNGLAVLIREFNYHTAWNREVAAHTDCGAIEGVANILNKFSFGGRHYIVYPTFDCTLKQYALDQHIREQSRTTRVEIIKQLVELMADIHHVGYVLRVYGISSFALMEVAGVFGGHRIRVYSLGCVKGSLQLEPISRTMCTVKNFFDIGTDNYEPLWAPPEATDDDKYGHKSDVFVVGKISMYLLFGKFIPIANIALPSNWMESDRSGLKIQFLQMTLGDYNNRPSARTLQKHLLFATIGKIQDFIGDLNSYLRTRGPRDDLVMQLDNIQTRLEAFGHTNWKHKMTNKIMQVMPVDPEAPGYKITALIRILRNLDAHREDDPKMSFYYPGKLALFKEVTTCCPNFIPVVWYRVLQANIPQLAHHF